MRHVVILGALGLLVYTGLGPELLNALLLGLDDLVRPLYPLILLK